MDTLECFWFHSSKGGYRAKHEVAPENENALEGKNLLHGWNNSSLHGWKKNSV